jgi:hypothetical protein
LIGWCDRVERPFGIQKRILHSYYIPKLQAPERNFCPGGGVGGPRPQLTFWMMLSRTFCCAPHLIRHIK